MNHDYVIVGAGASGCARPPVRHGAGHGAADEPAVLDPELRVRGVDGLRVVDASAVPGLVSGNINACVLTIAEKAADPALGKPPLSPIEA